MQRRSPHAEREELRLRIAFIFGFMAGAIVVLVAVIA